MRRRIEARSAAEFDVARGALLCIVDPEGGQVADLVAFARGDIDDRLSNGRTFDYGGTLFPTTGNVLYSSRSRAMLTIVADDVGRHDFLHAACSPEMFRIQYAVEGEHPSCLTNLAAALAERGVSEAMIPTPFNAFMHVDIATNGRLDVHPPRSRPGDAIVLRAEMDLVVGVAACSSELCSGGRCTPIDVEIRPGESQG